MTALEPILALMAVAGLAALLALLLRAAGLSRTAVLAGLIAGSLAGATVFGRVLPEWHERLFVGGGAERQAVEHLRGRQGADLAALAATGVSDAATLEMKARHADESAAALAAYESARAAHQSPRIIACAVLALALLVSAMPRSRPPIRWSECIFTAMWTLVVVCAVIGLAVVFAFGGSRGAAVALGLCFACAGTIVLRPSRDGEAPDEKVVLVPGELRDHLVNTALVIWFVCFVAAFISLLTADQRSGALAAHPAVRTAPAGIVLGLVLQYLPHLWRHALRMIILPSALTALLLADADLLTAAIIGPLILALLVGGDARWLGLASALRWLGRPWRDGWVATIPLVDVGAIQASLAGVFFLAGALDAPLFACAIFGAVVCDLAQPLRPRLLSMLSEPAEDQSDS